MGCSSDAQAGNIPKAGGKGQEEVLKLIEDNPVMVFSKSWCPFCKKTKNLL